MGAADEANEQPWLGKGFNQKKNFLPPVVGSWIGGWTVTDKLI